MLDTLGCNTGYWTVVDNLVECHGGYWTAVDNLGCNIVLGGRR